MTFIVKAFRIYDDAASAEVLVDGVGKIEAKVNISKELLEQIKKETIDDIQRALTGRFEKKSEVIRVLDFKGQQEKEPEQ